MNGPKAAPVRRRGVAAAVASFLIEPIESDAPAVSQWPDGFRPVVAVAGLRRDCGVTTVARALATELALRDVGGAALVTAAGLGPGGIPPMRTVAAGRLARAASRSLPSPTRAAGRLCVAECPEPADASWVDVARRLAPLVIDVKDHSDAAVAASLVDAVVLIASPSDEPALADVVSQSLGRVGPEPIVVLNRDLGDGDRWREQDLVRLPEARVAARLASAGRETRGAFGRSVEALAEQVTRGSNG